MEMLSITESVMAFFKKGEKGNVNSFFLGRIKDFKSEISGVEHTNGTLEYDFKKALRDLTDELEDANRELDEAWINVDPEVLGTTNKSHKEYAGQYMANIESAREKVEDLEEEIIQLKSNHEEEIKSNASIIKELNWRIDKLQSNFKKD